MLFFNRDWYYGADAPANSGERALGDISRHSDVLAIRFDHQCVVGFLVNRLNKPLSKLNVSNQRYTQVYGSTTDQIIVAEFFFLKCFRDVDHQIDLALFQILQGVW